MDEVQEMKWSAAQKEASGHKTAMLWQLADSAFPAGGLAHSQGLEASMQSGRVQSTSQLKAFSFEMLQLQAASSLTFLASAHADPSLSNILSVDSACEASLVSNHVAHKASVAQGKGFLSAAAITYPEHGFKKMKMQLFGSTGFAGHQAVIVGLVCSVLGLELKDSKRLFLFMSLRGIISAAVRLGICGPLEGQHVQARVTAEVLEELVNRDYSSVAARGGAEKVCWDWDWETAKEEGGDAGIAGGPEFGGLAGVYQTSPVVDLLQGTQDRMYSHLFAS